MAAERSHVLVKTLVVGGSTDIIDGILVKFGADDDTVVPAAAATDKVIGVAYVPTGQDLPIEHGSAVPAAVASPGDPVDVVMVGIANTRYGAAVARGDRLISNASGKAIPSAAITDVIIGVATVSGVADDLGCVLVVPSAL